MIERLVFKHKGARRGRCVMRSALPLKNGMILVGAEARLWATLNALELDLISLWLRKELKADLGFRTARDAKIY